MLKKYISKSDISISVIMEKGGSIRVSFSPVTGGGSVFYTEDEAVQNAMEKHHSYGDLFFDDNDFVAIQKQPKEKVDHIEEESARKEVHVTDIDDAKDYVCEHFGVSRSKLKTKNSIINMGKSYGIEFIGL